MIRIITDSGCDLPDQTYAEFGIEIVPLTVRFGETDFVDRVDLSRDEFWEKLIHGDDHPQTAAPSVGQFTEVFERLAAGGADGILVMCMSSAISATHQSATLAAEAFNTVPVEVLDTQLVAGALGLAVLEAAEQARAGADLAAVASTARAACESTFLYATLDTLEYLRKGGRIGSAAAFVGGLLDVKPIIAFEEGKVAAAGRVRTRSRALADVYDHLRELGGSVQRLGVIVSAADDAEEFKAAIADIHGSYPIVLPIGPIVGTHAGPGTLGIAYRLG